MFLLSHLLIGDRSLLLIGQLHQRADVCAKVSLTADQQDTCAWTEVQNFSFPLWTQTCDQFSEIIVPKYTVNNYLPVHSRLQERIGL